MPVVEIPRTHLNLAAVLLNGQSFRWLELGGHFYGTAREKMWKIRRLDDKKVEYEVLASISGKAECSKEEETHFRDYFNLSIDMDELYSTWSKVDPHIKLLLSDSDDLKGIRILNQDPVETLFAFICSANNNIKRISKMVNRLCSLYGSPLVLLDGVGEVERRVAEECPQLMYAFPTVAQLAENVADMQEQLSEDSFGYRAGYIAGSVKHFINMKEDLDRLRFPQEARERLLAFSGVGPKVADCVSLMGLGHHHVVPIDTHVYKSTVKHYRKDLEGKSLTNALHTSLGQFYKDKFGTHAGWAQAILFNAQLQASPAKRAKKTKNGVVEKEK